MSSISKHTRTRLIWRNGKKVRAHRWIIEQHIGRKLLPEEHIHHKNGDPLDNRVKNLEIIEHKKHMKLHKQIYPDVKKCARCGEDFEVNPRKRKRNKCCSKKCAQEMRMEGQRKARLSLSVQNISED